MISVNNDFNPVYFGRFNAPCDPMGDAANWPECIAFPLDQSRDEAVIIKRLNADFPIISRVQKAGYTS